MKRVLHVADLFAGAGGASSALRRAASVLGLDYELLAVNHWPTAIETHSLNHPGVRHLCESIERVNPREVIPGGRLHLLLAAPECTNHSRARGGRPVNDQSRATAWHILKWAQELYIDNILIENVEEFREWGPVGTNGKPLKSRKGDTFQAFLTSLKSLGYDVDHRVLNAADFGDPTTRRRLFIIARRGRRQVAWPTPSHAKTGQSTLFAKTQKWRGAREVIDWSITGKSIFGRKKPLSPKTMARILQGLTKFGGKSLEPWLVVLRNNMGSRSLGDPMPTVTAGGQHVGIAEPFIMHVTHGGRVRSIKDPVPTVTCANRGEMALIEPFILQQQSGGSARGVSQPLPTIATKGAQAIVMPFLVPMFGEREGQTPRTHDVDEPMPTVTATKGGPALVEPIITAYYGTSTASSVASPLPTVTTKDRFGLVVPEINGQRLDIRFRMLQPHELAKAMSFDASYKFAGNRGEQVKQIGNAWPVSLGEALIKTLIGEYAMKTGSPSLAAAAK